MISAFSAAFISAVFLVGNRLYGPVVALIASLALLATPSLIFWIPRHIDPVWPTYLLFALLALLSPAKRDTEIGIIAAILTFLAVLTKNVAISFLPAVALIWMLRIVPGAARRVIVFLALTCLLLTCWHLYLATLPAARPLDEVDSNALWTLVRALQTGRFSDADMTAFLEEAQLRFPNPGLPPLQFSQVPIAIATCARALMRYVAGPDGLLHNLPWSPVLLCGYVVLIARAALRRGAPDLVIVCLSLAFLPFVLMCAVLNYRLPQALIIICLIYLATAEMGFTAVAGIISPAAAYRVGLGSVVALVLYGLVTHYQTSAVWPNLRRPTVNVALRIDPFATKLFSLLHDGDILASNDAELLDDVFLVQGNRFVYRRLRPSARTSEDLSSRSSPDLIVINSALEGAALVLGRVEAAGYSRSHDLDLTPTTFGIRRAPQ